MEDPMKTMSRILRASLLLSASLVGCGDTKIICDEGTFELDGACVAFDPADATPPTTTVDPAGGRSRLPVPAIVTLKADEPAQIYWSTDGTEPDASGPGEISPVVVPRITDGTVLKVFSIDRAGNREATRTITFDEDVTGPGRPGLALTASGTDANLAITAPPDADVAGTVLARVTGALDAVPANGMLYTAGTALSANVQIVAVGTGATFTDPGRPPGFVRYVAWSYDDLGNYGPVASAHGAFALGSLSAQLSIDTNTNTVTVPTAMGNVTLAGTATTTGTNVSLDLTVTNTSTKYFQAPKLMVTAVTGGTFSNADGTVSGVPFKNLGPDQLAPADNPVRTLTFSGVASGATVVVDVTLAENALLIGGGRSADAPRVVITDPLAPDLGNSVLSIAAGRRGNRGASHQGCTSPDGRYSYTGNSHARVERFDMSDRTNTGGVLASTFANDSADVVCDGQGAVYAVLSAGGRRNNNNNGFGNLGTYQVVRYTEDLQELGRVNLTGGSNNGFARAALSPDGRMIAIPGDGDIMLVDVVTMRAVDADPATTEVDGLQTEFLNDARIRGLAWSPDSTTLYAHSWSNGGLARFDFQGGTATRTSVREANQGGRSGEIEVGPDGRVWITNESLGLDVYTPSTGVLTDTGYGGGARGIEFVGGRIYVLRSDRQNVDEIDATGATLRTFSLPAASQQHWLSSTRN